MAVTRAILTFLIAPAVALAPACRRTPAQARDGGPAGAAATAVLDAAAARDAPVPTAVERVGEPLSAGGDGPGAGEPALAVFAGEPYVAWSEAGKVHVRRRAASGWQLVGKPLEAAPEQIAGLPSLAAGSGGLFLAWSTVDRTGQARVETARWKDGAWAHAGRLPTRGRVVDARLTDTDVHAVWRELDRAGAGRVRAVSWLMHGDRGWHVDADSEVPRQPRSSVLHAPSLGAYEEEGGWHSVVGWVERGPDGPRSRVFYFVYDANSWQDEGQPLTGVDGTSRLEVVPDGDYGAYALVMGEQGLGPVWHAQGYMSPWTELGLPEPSPAGARARLALTADGGLLLVWSYGAARLARRDGAGWKVLALGLPPASPVLPVVAASDDGWIYAAWSTADGQGPRRIEVVRTR